MGNDQFRINRRVVLGGMSASVVAGMTSTWAKSPALPAAPVVVTVMDVGGALALMQPAFEEYAKAYPERASRIIFTKAPVTELAGKLKAQQSAGRVDIDIVLTGSDGLAAGLANETWLKILPDFADKFPGIEENYEPAALALHKAQGDGFGVVVNYYPSGPLIEYDPERVKKFRRALKNCWPGPRKIPDGSCMPARPIPVPAAHS